MTPPAIVLARFSGWTIEQPTSGGKAGKGCAKTSSIQVVERHVHGSRLAANYRYVVGNLESRTKAIRKAHVFVKAKLEPANPIPQ